LILLPHSITLLYIFNILFSFNVNFLIYRLKEEATLEATKSARKQFRGSVAQRPPFACDCCLRPFVFDYEIVKHKLAMDDNCEHFDTYDQLRKETFEKNKKDQEEKDVLYKALEYESKLFEQFRRPGVEVEEF